MHVVTATRTIAADHPKVWSALADFGTIHRFHPGVRKSHTCNGVTTGMGAQRVCQFYDGGTVKETVIGFEENRAIDVELSDFSIPLKRCYLRLEALPLSDGATQTSISVRFEPKFGVLGWLLAHLMMKALMRRDAARVLKGLEDHLGSGLLIGPGGKLLENE